MLIKLGWLLRILIIGPIFVVLYLPFKCGVALSEKFKSDSINRNNCCLLYYLIKAVLSVSGFALGCAANVIAIPIAVVIIFPCWLAA
jgi:hypothetical protein